MYSRLREQFGTAGLIVAIVALIAALAGGAYAASNGATSSKTKVVKGPKGPKGAKGDTGPAGPVGPAGAKGDNGGAGANGTNGSNGAAGAAGTSVTASNEATGTANCSGRGGSKFVAGASTTFACNGATGAAGAAGATGATGATGAAGKDGKDGSPWTAGGVLPPEATETGTWAFSSESNSITNWLVLENEEVLGLVPVSFPIPLPAGTPAANVINTQFSSNPNCPGTVSNPQAAPGYFCLYVGTLKNAAIGDSSLGVPVASTPDSTAMFGGPGGTGTAGAVLNVITNEDFSRGVGTWAVTAPEAS